MNNKALSLIISAVLLITIVLVLALIIFFWAKSFIVALEPAGLSCNEVNFEAGIFGNILEITNNGNIDVYGLVLKEIKEGSITLIVEKLLNNPLESGYSDRIEINEILNLNNEANLLIVPIISEESVEKEILHTCPDEFGIEVVV